MSLCLYCGASMSNPRRVQCGAPECERQHANQRARRYQREWRSHQHDSGHRHVIRTCVQCGKQWKTRRKVAKYCSFSCQAAHQHADKRKQRTERRRAVARRGLVQASKGSAGRTAWVTGQCSECKHWFSAQLPGARTCSPACRKTRKRRRLKDRSGFVTQAIRLAIYERDSWTCQLCFDPVDPSLHFLDNWAATLDHIVCRSWSEEPDHSPENLRLAHRWCNSVRGDESHHDPAVLVAA